MYARLCVITHRFKDDELNVTVSGFLSDPSPIIGYACQWLPNWLTDCRLVNLIDVSLACEDGNSKLVEVVDDEKQFTP